MSELAVHVQGLHKSYRMGRTDLHVLRGVGLDVSRGEFVSVVGTSGSGKSTLLHMIGLLDKPDKGKIIVDDVEVETLSASRRNRIRCRDIGFVFQFYHLLPELNVLENVLLPAHVDCSVLGWLSKRGQMRARAMDMLEKFGLADRRRHKPKELSGGERQRVAIARALINRPKLLLADEPTGNLDRKTGMKIMEILRQIHDRGDQTVIMVTHDLALAEQSDKVLHLHDGRLAR